MCWARGPEGTSSSRWKQKTPLSPRDESVPPAVPPRLDRLSDLRSSTGNHRRSPLTRANRRILLAYGFRYVAHRSILRCSSAPGSHLTRALLAGQLRLLVLVSASARVFDCENKYRRQTRRCQEADLTYQGLSILGEHAAERVSGDGGHGCGYYVGRPVNVGSGPVPAPWRANH